MNAFLHEFGHVLDLSLGWHEARVPRATSLPLFNDWNTVVSRSHRYIELFTESQRHADVMSGERPYEYLLHGDETWARSYAQYIAARSQDPALVDEVNRMAESRLRLHMWEPGDFDAIASATDALFQRLGWI
jgi:hypothetical protein